MLVSCPATAYADLVLMGTNSLVDGLARIQAESYDLSNTPVNRASFPLEWRQSCCLEASG